MRTKICIEPKTDRMSLITGIAFASVPHWFGSTRRNLLMDILTPKNITKKDPRPCILFLCGGAYAVVDHAVWLPELTEYVQNGYIGVTAEYRTTNEAMFPAQLQDVKSAIRYLKAHADDYGIDPSKIIVMGESAGGTLASLAGTTGKRKEFDTGDYPEQTSEVCAVVDIYGQTLLTDPGCVAENFPEWPIKAFVGEDPETAARASAVNYVDAGTPPFLILHGNRDQIVPFRQSELLYEALTQAGVQAELLEIEGANHGDDRIYQPEIKQRVLEFMNRVTGYRPKKKD